MAIYGLISDRSAGRRKKLATVVASITGTGAVTTGLSSVDDAHATVQNSGTALPTRTASVTSISGGTVNVVVTEHASAANSVPTTASNVAVRAVGD